MRIEMGLIACSRLKIASFVPNIRSMPLPEHKEGRSPFLLRQLFHICSYKRIKAKLKQTKMSWQEKVEARFERWLNAHGIEFDNEEAERSYKKSIEIFIDAVRMQKLPDRAPIYISGTFLVPNLYKLTPHEATYEYDKSIDAHLRFLTSSGQ